MSIRGQSDIGTLLTLALLVPSKLVKPRWSIRIRCGAFCDLLILTSSQFLTIAVESFIFADRHMMPPYPSMDYNGLISRWCNLDMIMGPILFIQLDPTQDKTDPIQPMQPTSSVSNKTRPNKKRSKQCRYAIEVILIYFNALFAIGAIPTRFIKNGKILTQSDTIQSNRWIDLTIRYDTRCYFNVRSKADISQLNLPHGTDN